MTDFRALRTLNDQAIDLPRARINDDSHWQRPAWERAAEGCEPAEDSGPISSEPVTWALRSPKLPVYVCEKCGSSLLVPLRCCARRPRRSRIEYYLASQSGSAGIDPDFSIIMLTYNNLALTRTAVDGFLRARGEHSIEFVFVDCCSTDGSLDYFRDLARRETVRLIVTHPEEPFVYARNCNRGAQAARGRFLVFSNNDVEAKDSNLLEKLARCLADPRVGVVGTRADHDCTNELQEASTLPAERVWSVKPVQGFCWGVRAEVFSELGGLDERFRDYGCDEIDFEYRAVLANYRLAVIDSLVHHEQHATFGEDIREPLKRNMERFHAKHGCRLFDKGSWFWPFLSHRYPQLSVAIATRNHAKYLPRALDSIRRSYLPSDVQIQIVVADDASVDDTGAVLAQYRTDLPRSLNTMRRAVSRGPAAAKNHAMARCIGDYTALLDADDEFLEYKLWRSLETLQATGADFLYHDYALVLSDGSHQRQHIGEFSLARWREGKNLPPTTWVFRSGVVRFNERYVTGEDPDFLRRRWDGLRSIYIPEVLSRYYTHRGSLSSRATCSVVTSQLRGLPGADVQWLVR
jgi:glycosyltransferase involved in cell wall biosynthesis